jgi:tetrahydromethanopterin S-methyltransferase subunit F
MNYVLTFVFLSAIAVAALKNLRFAAMVFVFLLSLMPRYLDVSMGSNLLPTRIILLALLFVLSVVLMQQNQDIKKMIFDRLRMAGPVIWISLFVLFFSAVVSVFIGHARNWSILSLGFDFLNSIGMLVVVFALTRDKKTFYGLLAAITLGLFIGEILAVVEFQYQQVLLHGLIDASQISGTEFFTDRSRDDQYRVRALFDNHLMLSEYVAMAWPIAWVVYSNSQFGWRKLLALMALLFTPLVLYLAGARSGWLIFAIGVWLLIFMQLRLKHGRYFRWLSNVLILLALGFFAYKAIGIVNAPEQFIMADDSSGASTLERIGQYLESLKLFMASPWFGYGKGLDLEGANFLMYIDSYMLVALLEGGGVGLIFFLTLWTLVLKHAAKLLRLSQYDKHDKNIALGLTVAAFSLLIDQFFISIPWNNIYLFLIEGLIVVQLGDCRT